MPHFTPNWSEAVIWNLNSVIESCELYVFARDEQLQYVCLVRVPNSSRLSPLSIWHPCFIFWMSCLLITANRLVALFVFPQFLQENSGLIPSIIPRLLPSKPFAIRYSLTTPFFDVMWLQDNTEKRAHFVASYIRQLRINIRGTDRNFAMKSSHSFVTKRKLFQWYVPETVNRTEVSWMLLLETKVWKGGEYSDCGLRDCETV